MRSLRPEQILLLLVVVLLPLLNLLGRWLQRRMQEQQKRLPESGAARVPEAARMPLPEPSEAWPHRPRRPEAEGREERLPVAIPPVREVALALSREERRRPAPARVERRPRRRRTLGGPEGVRRAIVAMAILGPCPGLEEPARPGDPTALPPLPRRP
jgi:hypothetical protein